MLQISSTAQFRKSFNKLSSKLQDKVVLKLETFAIDPFDPRFNNHQLHGEYVGCRSINVTGDLRIIYEKIHNDLYVLHDIGTHSQLYE